MSRTKNFALNTLFTMLNRLIVMIVGFITPRLLLVYFGSSINGLISSISQFVNYFNLVEAGLSNASVVALYKPLAEKNKKAINEVVSATKKYYYQSGYVFTLMILILAVLYPTFTSTNELANIELTLLIVFIGANGFLNFFSLAKYRALLTAAQKIYVISIASSLYTILHTLVIIIGVYFEYSIISIYFFSIFAMLSRNIILYVYVKKYFSDINFNAKPNYSALNKRWDALIIQFAGLAQNSAPTLLITFFLSLGEVSIFTIYNMVVNGIQGILGIFTNSLASAFGDLIARNDKKGLIKTYNEFELMYLMLIAIVYLAFFNLMLPFIRLYTSGVNDVNYELPLFSFLVVLNSFIYIIKTPQGMLINSAGHFKETKYRALFQALIIIFGGVFLVNYFGLLGVIIAMVISNIYRFIDMFFYVPNHIIKSGFKLTLKNYFLMLIIMLISQVIISLLNPTNITSFYNWILSAIIIVLISLIIVLVINVLFNRKDFGQVLIRLKSLNIFKKV